jgi:hypothetical protein
MSDKQFQKLLLPGMQAVMLLFIILVFHKKLMTLALVLALMIIAALSVFYKRFTGVTMGFELITFAVFVFYYAFGPAFAMVAGTLTLILSHFVSGKLDVSMLIKAAGYIFVLLLLIPFGTSNPVFMASLMMIAWNIILAIAYFFFWGSGLSGLPSIALNIILNILLFSRVLLPLVGVLQ